MASRNGILDWIERIGNRLPDPATLFLIGTIVVMLLSHVAYVQQWSIEQRLPQRASVAENETSEQAVKWAPTGEVYRAQSLLTRDGLFWLIKNMVGNFMKFPPLGVVLVGMLGIGIAERTGLIATLLKGFMAFVPNRLLTPAVMFIGIMSSLTLDAGYVVLPPLAAALYKAAGRSPLVGVAAVFAGVSAGFNANLLITGLDPMLAGFSTTGAQVIEEGYTVNPACNWWFLITSTFLLTFCGWGVTSFFVERRLNKKPEAEGGPAPVSESDLADQKITGEELGGLKVAAAAFLLTVLIFGAMIVHGSGPLHGMGEHFQRWVEAIVPMLFFVFAIPGIAYGVAVKNIRNDKDAAKLMIDSMAAMAPIIVLAFFAAQFIEGFQYSGLGKMLATAGGQALGQAEMSRSLLLIAFIGLTILFNLFIGSMSAKYALFAPIFVPMFMVIGISPELTQVAYRIGDSVSNIITPLNPYLIIILVYIEQYVPKAGLGTLISTMFPYTIAFTVVWCILLLVWLFLGIPLGPDGGLTYMPMG